METSIDFYKRCIKQALSEYENLKTDHCKTELVFDDEHGRYLVVWLGWQGQKRIHTCSVHIDIVDENIVIQWNDTEELLDERLIEMGVARSSIVIGTIPPELRDDEKDMASYSVAA